MLLLRAGDAHVRARWEHTRICGPALEVRGWFMTTGGLES